MKPIEIRMVLHFFRIKGLSLKEIRIELDCETICTKRLHTIVQSDIIILQIYMNNSFGFFIITINTLKDCYFKNLSE